MSEKALPASAGRPDDFQTPPEALLPLLDYLPETWRIWECAEGRGFLVDGLREHGYSVVGSDILSSKDFLSWQPDDYDAIVTNPPYAIKDKFLQRAYRLEKPFAFLLPPRALEGRLRQSLYKKHGLGLLLLDRRIEFLTPSGQGSGSWFPTAWFTHGLGFDREIRFGHVPKHKTDGRPVSTSDLPMFAALQGGERK